jgi:hypothetical protein
MAGLGAKLFSSFSKLTAAQVNGYLMDQSIMRFANAAARDAAFGGAGEPTLAEGMFCYLDDENVLQTYTGSAWVQVLSADGKSPRGVVSLTNATSNLTFAATETVSITAATFTAVANRYYRVIYFEPTLPQVQNNNQVIQRLRVTNTAGVQLQATIYTNTTAVAGATNSATLVYVGTFTAGSVVLVGSLQSPGASVSASRSSDRPAQIIIEDIGAV